MTTQIVVTTDNSILARLARLFGAKWTHIMLRFPVKMLPVIYLPQPKEFADKMEKALKGVDLSYMEYYIIEATMKSGVIKRQWNPDEYIDYVAYELKPEHIADNTDQRILSYAEGNIGKWYAWDKLLLLVPRFFREVLKRSFKFSKFNRHNNFMSLVFTGERAHICSSLVDDSFYMAGVDLVKDSETPWVLPNDIIKSKALKKKEESK